MEFAQALRILRARWWATLAIVVVAIGAAFAARESVTSVPTGAATVQVLVNSPTRRLPTYPRKPCP